MSVRSVFGSLQELFPQIDPRVLKAVALEHYTDADAAVEFILSELFPSLDPQQKEPSVSSVFMRNSIAPDAGQMTEGTHENKLRVDQSSVCASSSEVLLEKQGNDFPVEHHKETVEVLIPVSSSDSVTQLDETVPLLKPTRKVPFKVSDDHFESDLGSIPGHSDDLVRSTLAENMVHENSSTVDALMIQNDEKIIENDRASADVNAQSDQTVSIEYLEELIVDCEGIKDFIASEVESVLDLAREVDSCEKEAQSAKDEASKAGSDTLAQFEDLKEMLKNAEEANKMHAAEIYGEKSILATEAKELLSRLLSLSEQRHNTLAVTEEIRRNLKTRLDAAQSEILEFVEVKNRKEEEARRALEEQETIMNSVVLESKRLYREDEENSKLREFLVERGRLVDTLQGEISVICEDVMKLKDRVDQGLPLGRSLSSSQILPSLTTSTHSVSSTVSDGPLDTQNPSASTRLSEAHNNKNLDSFKEQPRAARDDNFDDWEYFEDDTVGSPRL